MWRLPLHRAIRYYHAILRMEGIWTVPPTPSVTANLDGIAELFDTPPNSTPTTEEFLW